MRRGGPTPALLVLVGIGIHIAFVAVKLTSVPLTDLDVGHDGFYFSAQAEDPFILDPSTADTLGDWPAYRAARIAFPLIAYPLALLAPPELALLMVQIAFVGLGVFGTARLAEQHGLSPTMGLAFAVLPAALISTAALLADGVAAAAVVWLIVKARETKPTAATLWGILAVLTKEAMLLPVAVVALGRWRSWSRRDSVVLLAAPAAIAGLWRIVLMLRLDGSGAGENLTWPFQGFYQVLTDVWLPFGLWADLTAGTLTMLLAVGAIFLFARSWREPLSSAAIGLSAGLFVVSSLVLDLRWNSLRIAGPLFLLLLIHALAMRPTDDGRMIPATP